MAVQQLVLIGDSLTQGTVGSVSYRLGGQGNWAQFLRERLANLPGLGPLVSSGMIGLISGTNAFVFTTGGNAWTTTATTDAWDKAPYGASDNGSTPLLKYANGSAKTATWTATADINYPNVGFCIYYLDYTSAGNWSYSLDGGSTWTAMGQTITNGNVIKKFYVATPITSTGTVIIRAADTSGTGVGCAPLGIEVFYQTPSTASGLIVHNVSIGGSDLHHLAATTSGDRLAWFDSVTAGTGCITNTPNLGVIHENVNDITEVGNTTTWATDLTTLQTRLAPLGPVGFWSAWELSIAVFGAGSGQQSYRTKTKTTAAGFSPISPVLDLYDWLVSNGIVGNTPTNSYGYLFDLTHESQAGHILFANLIYQWIRQNFLTAYAGYPSTYMATGKQAAVQYTGKQTAVQYSAGSQIAPVPV